MEVVNNTEKVLCANFSAMWCKKEVVNYTANKCLSADKIVSFRRIDRQRGRLKKLISCSFP